MKFNTSDFFEKLEPLIANGIALDKAMSIINRNAPNEYIDKMYEKIKQGSDLSAALNEFPEFFTKIDMALIKAGENSGKLAELLKKLMAYRKHQAHSREQLKKALFYPSLVLSVSLIISAALFIFIIPQFQSVFSSFNAALPWLTQEVITLSQRIKNDGFIFLIVMLTTVIALKKSIAHSPCVLHFLQAQLLKTPFLGQLIQKNHLGLCCYLIATTQQSGLPILHSLELAKQSSRFLYFQNKLTQCQAELQQGALLSETWKNQALIDAENIALLQVGEATGTLPIMLERIAERFASSAASQLEYLHKLIEPLIMLFLALVAGTLIVAMYLPIFSMGVVIH